MTTINLKRFIIPQRSAHNSAFNKSGDKSKNDILNTANFGSVNKEENNDETED